MGLSLMTLGVSSASPTKNRFPSAHVLQIRGRLVLIDCGESAQALLVRNGVSLLKIDDICISHIHGDHVFGLFGLLSTMSMKGRVAPLNIYAPQGLDCLLSFFRDFSGDYIKYEIRHIPVGGDILKRIGGDENFDLYSFPLKHSLPSWGYLFRERCPLRNVNKESITPRSFAYCCDTVSFEKKASYIRNADLLLHEATFAADMDEMAESTGHSTTLQAAQSALDAGVGKLVITHYSSRYQDLSVLLNEARSIFPATELAEEGRVFDV